MLCAEVSGFYRCDIIVGKLSFFLCGGDRMNDSFGGKILFVDILFLHDLSYEFLCVVGVINREGIRKTYAVDAGSENADAYRMERSRPDLRCIVAKQF